MRATLISLIVVCAVGIWLTFETESLQEELALCGSEATVEYYQRRCRMEVVDDHQSGAVFLFLYNSVSRL